MKVSIFIALLISIILTGCFKGEGQVRIESDIQNAIIYIDGDKKGMTGDGATTIILEEGEHKVRVYKEKNEEWFYEGTQDIFVGENSSVKIKIDTDTKPTEFRLKRLAKAKKAEEERLAREKKAEEERLAREKKEAIERGKQYGLSSYPLGTFYDVDTKLMWQDNSDAKSVKKDWSGVQEYCKSLTIGEYSDWRLPEYNELLSIVDYNKANPVIKKGFKNVASSRYWSSSESVSYSSKAWYVNFSSGNTYSSYKSSKSYVRCVRGRQ